MCLNYIFHGYPDNVCMAAYAPFDEVLRTFRSERVEAMARVDLRSDRVCLLLFGGVMAA